jgi:hypothetical protein
MVARCCLSDHEANARTRKQKERKSSATREAKSSSIKRAITQAQVKRATVLVPEKQPDGTVECSALFFLDPLYRRASAAGRFHSPSD